MSRPKKNGKYLNVYIDLTTYNELSELCLEAGQSKTVAVERALAAYFDDYMKKKKILQELAEKND